MNFLAHLHLAGDDEWLRLGGLMGDYVKGPLAGHRGRWSRAVLAGVELHRRIDAFAETAPAFRRSRRRLAVARPRVSGVVVDIAYDHFLCRHWPHIGSGSLEDFTAGAEVLLRRHRAQLPVRLADALPRLLADNWLRSYQDQDGLARTFARMSGRLRDPSLLLGAARDIERHYAGLEADFLAFLPAAERVARRFRDDLPAA